MITTKCAAQPVLTDDEIVDLTFYGESRARMIKNGRAVESALLSKLRAEGVQAGGPVADSMTARVDAAMVEMKNIHPPLRRSECERLIRAALASAPVAREAVSWEDVRDSLAMFLSGATGKASKHWVAPLEDATASGPLAKMRACLASPLASAPVVPQACPTDVCQAGQTDGVLCANDECDRANGVRPSAPVADERLADRLDRMAFAQPTGSQAQSDLLAAATIWRKHVNRSGSAPVAGEAKPVAWRAVWTEPTPGSTAWRDAHEVAPPDAAELSARGYSLEIAHAAPQASEAVRDVGIAASDDVVLPPLPEALTLQPGQLGHTDQTLDYFARAAVLADRQHRARDGIEKQLEDAAISLETISRRAGNSGWDRTDIRLFAACRARVARAALSPTQPTEQGERDE
jgi:hypothetical protein